jgi:glutamyl-tRNA reductase
VASRLDIEDAVRFTKVPSATKTFIAAKLNKGDESSRSNAGISHLAVELAKELVESVQQHVVLVGRSSIHQTDLRHIALTDTILGR